MSNPWDLKISDERIADSLPTFIIFCEDEVSEPIYFKYFETSKIKVNPIRNQKSMMDNVVNAIFHCKENDLFKERGGKLIDSTGFNQVWCVFDRDKEETYEKKLRGNILFDESLKSAESNGIKVAFSNDAFELWILLHFENINFENEEYKERIKYYERLTEIFKEIPDPNEYLFKVLQYQGYSYKNSLKSEKNFRNIVRPAIINNVKVAIERAKQLEDKFKESEKPEHEKSPYTLVHHLVEQLLEYGGKEINK